MSTAAAYARFCSSLATADVPASVREDAIDLVCDTIGVAIGADRVASSQSVLETARELSDGGGATVLATGERLSPQQAAFANGSLAHSLDYDDSHRASALHPGAAVIPAALAAGEDVDASGEAVLTGIVAGYEVACRLGAAVNPSAHYDRGFHVTGTCGLFGATAAVGSIRGLESAELEAAFGINGSQASGSVQFVESGAWNKRVHPGLAGQSAIVAVTLAENGFDGATDPIDGEHGFLDGYTGDPRPELTTEGLGETFELSNTALKPYPCCRFMHMPIDLLRELNRTESIDPEEIERIEVRIPEPGVKMLGEPANRYPRSFVDAQFNMPYVAALVLTESSASLDTFLEAADREPSPVIDRLIDRTVVREADWIEAAYPEALPGEVIVETANGTYSRRGRHPRGEPENRLTSEELRAKFDDLAVPVIGEERATTLHERIRDLESTSARRLLESVR